MKVCLGMLFEQFPHNAVANARGKVLYSLCSLSGSTDLQLAGNEGMDPYSSPYIPHDNSFQFLFNSFIPR